MKRSLTVIAVVLLAVALCFAGCYPVGKGYSANHGCRIKVQGTY